MLNITKKYLKNTIKLSITNINSYNRFYTSSTTTSITTPHIIEQQQQPNYDNDNNILDDQEDLFNEDEIENEQEILEYNERILKNKQEFEESLMIEKDKLGKLNLDSKQFKFQPKEYYTNFQPHTSIHIGDKHSFAIIRNNTNSILFEPYIKFYNEFNRTHSKNRFRLRWPKYGMDIKQFDFLPHCELTSLFDWRKKECHLFLLNLCSRIFNFNSLDGWYYVDNGLLIKFGIDRISKQYKNGFVDMLMSNYPYHNWDIEKFSKKDYQHLFYYNELLVEKYLKQYGYLSKIDKLPCVRLPSYKPHLPFHINQHIKSKFIGYTKVTLQGLFSRLLSSENRSHDFERYRSKYIFKNHLQLYRIGGNGPFDLEKLYNIDFRNDPPILVRGSVSKTIQLISSLDSNVLPWKFKYQSNDSELTNSKLLIDYIKKKFNLVNHKDWYDLKYTDELRSILPENWYYKISFLSYFQERYPSSEFTFDPKKFKDDRLFSHLFETCQVLRTREVLDSYALEKGLVIKNKSDWLEFQIDDKEFIYNATQYSQYKLLREVVPFVYPREYLNPKIVVTNEHSLEVAVKSLVKEFNLSMEDLYGFDFNQHIHSIPSVEKLFYLPKIYPDYPWVFYRFLFGNGFRLSLFMNFPNMDIDTRRKYSLQFFNYTMDNGFIVHPLDFLTLPYRVDYLKFQAKEMLENFDYHWILKEYYDFEIVDTIEMSSLYLVNFKTLKKIYAKYLNLNVNQFHLSSRKLMYSEFKKKFKKINVRKNLE